MASLREFNGLTGDAKYLGEEYRDHYSLDIEDLGMFDAVEKVMNAIANLLFSVVKEIAYAIVTVFYYAMSFDVSKLFSKQLNGIMKALNAGIFKPLFNLGFAFASFVIIKHMLKRNFMAISGEFIRIIGLILLSFLLVNKSAEILSATTNITKSVSVEALTGVNFEMNIESTQSFGASAAGTLWVNLVHNCWLSLEFGSTEYTDENVEKFLESAPDSAGREELVKEYSENLPKNEEGEPISDCFNENRGIDRIGFLIVYFIPFLLKGGIYLCVAVIQLAFQVLAVFWMLLAPVILTLSMFPGYSRVSEAWFRKMMETQIAILIVSFVMALLIKMDTLLYEFTPQWGWFMVMIMQTAICVVIFLKRKELLKGILNVMGGIQRNISNPRYARARMIRSGNLYESMSNLQKKIQVRSNLKNQQANTQQPRPRMFEKKQTVKKTTVAKKVVRQHPKMQLVGENSGVQQKQTSHPGQQPKQTTEKNTKNLEKTTIEKTKKKKIRMNLGTEEKTDEKSSSQGNSTTKKASVAQRTQKLRAMQAKTQPKIRPKMMLINAATHEEPLKQGETRTKPIETVNRPTTVKSMAYSPKAAQNGNNEVMPMQGAATGVHKRVSKGSNRTVKRTTALDAKVYCPKRKKKITLRTCQSCKHQEDLMCFYR